jgi:class 3 adenylate cyclase/tetratricopeptide (TPR) repeat protein
VGFLETIASAKDFLREHGRLSLRALRLEFELSDEQAEALIEELVDVQAVAALEGKVLSWIGSVPAGASVGEPREPKAAPPEPVPAPEVHEAERRQLTVMFCDLVGSTELSDRLDPEDLRDVVAAYQEICGEVIAAFDGQVAQYLGDGLLVYFGYPHAHEDDAIRAIHVGLRILDEVPRLSERLAARLALLEEHPLRVRIGVHTGAVVVGVMGGGQKREQLALGDTTNIAARLESIADPGTVVLSDATRRLVRGAFQLDDLGERPLKGIADPVSVFRAVRTTGVQSWLQFGPDATPLVGREQQMALLLERWQEATERRGQAVLLSGEAGMGKSRLVQTLREAVEDRDHTWQEYRCSAYHQGTALHPVAELLERVLVFTEQDGERERIEKLARGLHFSGFDPSETLPLVAPLLSLPSTDDYPALALSPEAQRRKTLELLCSWCLAIAEAQPLIVIAEDVHWADPSTVELVGMLMEQAPSAPILVVLTSRPGFEPPWPKRSHLIQLPLQPLTRKQVEAMVASLAGSKPLPQRVCEHIEERTDGIPLFVEELTKSVLESDLILERDRHYDRADPLPELAIPSTLQDSLTARLDRLGPAKEVAQIAAVLGRDFSFSMLADLAEQEPDALERSLGELVEADLVYRRGVPPAAVYTFKHALVQDTAHQSLLKKTRQRLHARVAMLMERGPAGRADPGVVARHLEEAGLIEEALGSYRRAGELAAERSENGEAIGHLSRAIELLDGLPEGQSRDEHELRLQTALGGPTAAATGWGSPEAERVYGRLLELSEREQSRTHLRSALSGLVAFHVTRSQLDTASELAQRFLLHADSGDRPARMIAHYHMGLVQYFQGRFAESSNNSEASIGLYDPALDQQLVVNNTNPGVVSRVWASWALACSGYLDRAAVRSREAIELAQDIGRPFDHAYALSWATAVCHMRCERERAAVLAHEAERLSEEQGFPIQLCVARLAGAWAAGGSATDDGGRMLEGCQQALAQLLPTGTQAATPHVLGLLTEVCMELGRLEQAGSFVEAALSAAETLAQPYWDAELHRLKGEILKRREGNSDEAALAFGRALEIAREQNAKLFQLRAATSLARLWHRQGRAEEAREVLHPIYGWFTEGFDTQDLKDARVLLEALE